MKDDRTPDQFPHVFHILLAAALRVNGQQMIPESLNYPTREAAVEGRKDWHAFLKSLSAHPEYPASKNYRRHYGLRNTKPNVQCHIVERTEGWTFAVSASQPFPSAYENSSK